MNKRIVVPKWAVLLYVTLVLFLSIVSFTLFERLMFCFNVLKEVMK